MVTGSGFDFIQTAVMMVNGSNMTAVEVRAPSLPPLLLLFILLPISLASSFCIMPYFAYLRMLASHVLFVDSSNHSAINIGTRCESISLASFKKKEILHSATADEPDSISHMSAIHLTRMEFHPH